MSNNRYCQMFSNTNWLPADIVNRRSFLAPLSRQWLTPLRLMGALLLAVVTASPAQDRTVIFGTSDAGVAKAVTNWGLDTAWYSEDNVQRGAIFMGSNRVDVVRISFTTTNALVAGELGVAQAYFLTNRLTWVDRWANPSTTVCINEDSPTIDPWYYDGSVVNSTNWAANIVAHAMRAKAWGRTVSAVAPFNEPDLYRAERQADMQKFYDTAGLLVTNSLIVTNNIRISGGNTLNTDGANSWYNFLKPRLDEGNTHQLAGSFDNYASFFQNVAASSDNPANDELHNVMEAMVGAEYGMQTGIWWGTAERARGEFVKASDGKRLGYAEHRPNWTAAAVYRGTNGTVQAFVGESERQALPTIYRFFSKDRDVFYDGDGPRRDYSVTTTGGPGYGTAAHRGAEKVVNINWGSEVQPAINGRYIVVNRNSTKAMEVVGGSTANGANIQQNTYTNGLNQQWDIIPVPHTNGGDYSYFTVTAAHSGKAADVFNFSLSDGGNVAQWDNANGVNQQWFFEYVTNGYFYIRSRWSGKYLEVDSASTANGANIRQFSLWTPSPSHQQWRLIPVGASPTDLTAPSTLTGVTATTNAVSVQLNWNASAASDLAGYTVLRSTNSGGPYETVARGLTNSTFTDKAANQNKTYYYVVKAVDRSLNPSVNSAQVSATPTGNPALVARYAFEGNANDSSSNANHHIIVNGLPTFPAGQYGTAMDLDGTNQYTMVPANMLASVTNFTFACWVNWDGGAAWQRIFDFGNDTTQYMFLSPSSGSGTLRFAITTNGGGGEQILETSPLPVGQWRHVAVTRNGNIARLYTNGVVAASRTNVVTLTPANFNPALNYLGKSQYADPLFNGRLDDLFIYNYALSDAEIMGLKNNQPPLPPAPTGLVATSGDGSAVLNWTASLGATGYKVKRSFVSGGPYTVLTTNVTTTYNNTGLANGTAYYYVVSAMTLEGESADSTQASANPTWTTPPNIAERIYALTIDNQLIAFDSGTPGNILSAYTVSGLQANEKIVGMDFWNGALYGLGDQSHLYSINRANGAAGLVGSFNPALNGQAFGFDAEPTGLRVVSDLDQNLLLAYDTGAATNGATINGSPNPALTGLAYHPANGQRYVADYSQNTIGIMNPSSGLVSTIGPAGIDFSRFNGFDISSNPGNTAYLASPAASSDPAANLYKVDLTTGAATLVGLIGLVGDNTLIRGLAVGPGYVELTPTNLTFNAADNQLTLSWPEDHIGWSLQVQTNTKSTGLSTNWFDVSDSSLTNSVVVPVDAGNGSVFYRLIYP